MYGIPENPMISPKTRICLYYVENDMNLLLDLKQLVAILDFLPTMRSLKYLLTTPLCTEYLKNPTKDTKTRIGLYYFENEMNLLLDLEQMAVILDFTHNAMSKLISDHTTRSGVPENPIVNTKIKKLFLFCRKCANLKFDLHQMAAILNLFNLLRSLKDILLISGRYAL